MPPYLPNPASAKQTFPLPDWLAAPSSRKPVQIASFAATPPDLSLPPLPTPLPQLEDSPSEPLEAPPRPLLTPLIASLQRSQIGVEASREGPTPRSPPTFADLTTSLQTTPPSNSPQVTVTVSAYDAEAPTKSVELHLRPSATLAQLIDAIPCTALAGEVSPTNGLLYVHGTLYRDMRRSDVDYAEPVRRFLSARDVEPTLCTRPAADVRVAELTVVLGVPYVYAHRGDCEHLLIFTDVFWNEGGEQPDDVSVTWRRPPRVVPCDVCYTRFASRFTVGDRLADASPFHYCDACFKQAHHCATGGRFRSSAQLQVFDHRPPV